MSRLQGKVAVVTGGNSGMGLASAQRLAAEGASVVITGRRQKELDEAVKIIGKNAIGVQGDVANLADLDRLYATIKAKHGHIDILFANAGVATFSPFEQVTEEHFDQLFNINVKGLLFTVQKALPLLKDGSSIILNASIAGNMGMAAFSVLFRYQSRCAFLRAQLGGRFERAQNPCECYQPRPHRHAHFRQGGLIAGAAGTVWRQSG